MDQPVLEKITIQGTDYLDTLLATIPKDNLPKFLGGNSECRCAFCESPKLAKTYYVAAAIEFQ